MGVFSVAVGAPAHFLVISRDGREIDKEQASRCIPGMPVFTPQAGQNAFGKLESLGLGALAAKLVKPASWPSNAWK